MNYQEGCRKRAQMLLDAADGVKFQYLKCGGVWRDLDQPTFNGPLHKYRRKPAKVRYERVVVWAKFTDWLGGGPYPSIFDSHDQADSWLSRNPRIELKRETIFVEIEE